jgi:CheY-like chemotaxis protein
MLVDDEVDILEIFKRGLETAGYTAETYNKPEEALENYTQNHYDRVLIDIRMPGMNGFELARAIWLKDPNAKVCFMTAFEIYEDEAKKVFKDFNTKCFLKKPVTTKGLIDHLDLHLLNA